MLVVSPLLAAVVLCNVLPAFGWGAAGHEIVATIAQIHLHPSVFPVMCDILNFTSTHPKAPLCHLAPVATWADKVRYKMRWSAALHYIGALGDHPPDTCLFPGDRGWAGRKGANVLGAVRNVTGILEDWVDARRGGRITVQLANEQQELANESLKFLVHFLGDMHMPLHLTGRDRGGNSVKVRFDGRVTNLHSLWDNLLIAKGLRTIPSNYSHPLPFPEIELALRGTIYDPYVRRIMYQGILGMWRDEVPTWLSCPAAPTPIHSSGEQQQVTSLWNGFRGQIVDQTDDDILCPYHWAKPIHSLNCELIWPSALDEPPYNQHQVLVTDEAEAPSAVPDDLINNKRSSLPYLELDTPEYAGVIGERWVVEKLLAMAGVRLAGVLNYLFADEGHSSSLLQANFLLHVPS